MTKKLVTKLADVMKEVKYIEKKGFNKFHKYKYATEADVNEKVREVLAEKNIIMVPNMVEHNTREHTNRSGNVEYIVTVNMEFRFIDGETGEEITFKMSGSGQDAGDKGIMKAISAAQKYALMKVFMIPTGDDPEADSGVDERNHANEGVENMPPVASDKQLNLIKKLIKEISQKKNCTESEALISLKKRMNSGKDFINYTSQEASKAIGILNEVKGGKAS